jgi:phage terminase large subunit
MSNRVQTVTLDYVPRAAFLPFHNRSKRKTVIVAHRRAGKTYSVIQDLVARALNFQKKNPKTGQYFPKPVFAYVCPYRGQAKKVAWEYLVAFTENIPGIKKNETELWIEIPTVTGARARIFLAGADNPDNLRGQYFDGVVLDEYGDMKPEVYSTVLRPALADRKGWVVFMGTPKGKNDFYKRWQLALEKPNEYFSICLKASDSGILDEVEIEDMKSEMETEEWEQELECSFDAAFRGSFYGKAIQVAALQDKFRSFITRDCPYGYVVDEPVSLAMDLGRADAAVIWFWQVIIGEVRFFDYWEQTGFDAEEVCDMLALKPYRYETVWLPHDAKHHTFVTKKSVIDTFMAHDLPARIAPDPDAGRRIMHGIDAVRKFLRLGHFAIDADRCKRGIEALKNYSRKFNRSTNTFGSDADHNEWSHGADAFRYAVLSISDDEIGRSIERARDRAYRSANPNQVNTRRQTLDEALAARDRQLTARSSNLSRAYD